MAPSDPAARVAEGSPEPLGVSLTPGGINVAVYSAHAEAIDLCLFDAAGAAEIERIRLPGRTGPVFHGHIEGVAEGARYGLRAHGRFAPAEGQRFNPNKLLVDPYALAIDRPFVLHPTMFGFDHDDPKGGDSFDETDSAPAMPKAIVVAPSLDLPPATPAIPWGETVIYELHVRGFTRTHPGIPEALRGTFAGLAHSRRHRSSEAAGRHHRRVAAGGRLGRRAASAEIRPDQLLGLQPRRLHGARSATGARRLGRGASVHPGPGRRRHRDLARRGGQPFGRVRCAGPRPVAEGPRQRRLLSPAAGQSGRLRRRRRHRRHPRAGPGPSGAPGHGTPCAPGAGWGAWGGFRFDLATVLGRRPDGFDPQAPLLAAIDQDPELRGLKLIAEPWDCAPGGYQLGRFPPAWGEWNDHFRRRRPRLLAGRCGVPGRDWRAGWLGLRTSSRSDGPREASTSWVSHDGFTLADLVAFTAKRNLANGEDNRDGTDDNRSGTTASKGPPTIRRSCGRG
ncbi:MAG: hypothetical protein WDM92_00020 [Caulobacteraceae bacterium]